MNVADARLSVVSAPLPQSDRRALSEAWYDALHLGSARGGISERAANPQDPSRPLSPAERGNAARSGAQRHDTPSKAKQAPQNSSLQALGLERRRAPGPVARRIVRALQRTKRRRRSASIAVRASAGRVQIIVRRDGAQVRLIALCTPEVRDEVERALAGASYVLARTATC
jgi:hypothetical protein